MSAPPEHRGERTLPRKPNYTFERRQRELAKAEKKAARLEARARKREERRAAEAPSGEGDGQPDESPPTADEVQ